MTNNTAHYVVEELANGRCNVVHLGPYTVSKGLSFKEAVALAISTQQGS